MCRAKKLAGELDSMHALRDERDRALEHLKEVESERDSLRSEVCWVDEIYLCSSSDNSSCL